MSAISATLGAAVRRAPAQFRARAPKASAPRAFTVRAMAGKEVIATDKSPAALGPYSQAIRAGNTLYVSGQIGLKAETMEFAGDTIEEQTEQVMSNMGEILKEAGADFKDVVKTTILLADMGDFKTVNEKRAASASPRTLPRAPPLRSKRSPQRPRRDRLHRLPPLDAPASARARGFARVIREIQHILLNLFTRSGSSRPPGRF